MKTLLNFLRPATIISALPNTIANGQVADATPVMADFNHIVNQVNANAAQLSLTPQLAAANTFTAVQTGMAGTSSTHFPISSQIQNDVFRTLTSTLGTNTITARNATLPLSALANGQIFTFIPSQTNTGPATLNPDAVGAAAIFLGGTNVISGQILKDVPLAVRYESPNFHAIAPGNASIATSVPVGGITGLGAGVATALAVNVGLAGAFVTFNGAGGTPSSMTATNLTGTAAGLTAGAASAVAVGGITGLGANVATFLATPTSANLFAAVATTTTGSGSLVGSASPTLSGTVGGALSWSGAQTFNAGAVIAASQALTGTVASSTISGFLSVAATTGTFTNVGGTLTTASQTNVTGLGTVTTGIWNAGAVTSSGAGSFAGAVSAHTTPTGGQSILTIGAISGDAGGALKFINTASYKNWQFSNNYINSGVLEWTPSTAAGGSTFTTPVMTLTNAGNLSVTGTITGTLATAAQPNITSLGTIAALVAGTGAFSGDVAIGGAASTGVVHIQSSTVNREMLVLRNTNTTGGADVPLILASNSGGSLTSVAIENAGAGTFVILTGGTAETLGGSSRLSITAAGAVTIPGTLAVTGDLTTSALVGVGRATAANKALMIIYQSGGHIGMVNQGADDTTYLRASGGAGLGSLTFTNDGGNLHLKIGAATERAGTRGTNVLDIFNGTAPTSTLANGVSLYSVAGKLYAMDAAGTATQLTP